MKIRTIDHPVRKRSISKDFQCPDLLRNTAIYRLLSPGTVNPYRRESVHLSRLGRNVSAFRALLYYGLVRYLQLQKAQSRAAPDILSD